MASVSPSNCTRILANGTCGIQQDCRSNHRIPTCESESRAPVLVYDDEHQRGLTARSANKHRNGIAGSSASSFCTICQKNVAGGRKVWKQHIRGQKHINKASIPSVSPNVQPQIAASMVDNNSCDAHLNGAPREKFSQHKTGETEADEHDITIEGSFDIDFVPPRAAKVGVERDVVVRATPRYALLDVRLASFQSARPVDSGFRLLYQRISRSSKPIIVGIGFKQPHVGQYEDRLELVFEDTRWRKRLTITRNLKVVVGDEALHQQLTPITPYIPRGRSAKREISQVIGGVQPPARQAIPYIGVLPKATIPAPLLDLLCGSESIRRVTKEIKKNFLPEVMNKDTYSQFFKHLLWIEEQKMERDLEQYDIPDAILTRHDNYYYLPVPGLAEKRPSVLVGDRILVQQHNTNAQWFEGHVHVIRKAEVGLCFHSSFGRYNEGKRLHVRFKLSRIPFRRQHQAMDSVFMEDRILFPLGSHLRVGRIITKEDVQLPLFNPLIAENEPQLQAVISIVTLPPGSPPFIVFGPPGTGKTITIVEAIQQVLATNSRAKILACAPSNSAADILASRLTEHLFPRQLFRFYAASRSKDQVPDELTAYTYKDKNGYFTIRHPAKKRMASFRVIITTCLSASVVHGIGMPRGTFSHIFIDEAGQATEPETFMSIKTMADTQTNVILSGDPKQLGPMITSEIAIELGLERSYLDRLMNRKVYNLRTGYAKSVVKLKKNFRSHQAILYFPNERFYDGELQTCGEPGIINYYLNSQFLPSKKFPIIFHAVFGKDNREASSPSFFNIDEVDVIRSYVQKLKVDQKFRTADEDIGIISPYHAQCGRLRRMLNMTSGLKIGSVEEFQGQEKKVIIISTVRSSKEFVEYDLRHSLGFVANPRRFNVAVTRAQALLIIVGDPRVLSLDPLWRSFLNYIYLGGGWTGPDITWDPYELVNVVGGYDGVRDAIPM